MLMLSFDHPTSHPSASGGLLQSAARVNWQLIFATLHTHLAAIRPFQLDTNIHTEPSLNTPLGSFLFCFHGRVWLNSILEVGMQRSEKTRLEGTGSMNGSSCHWEGSAPLTALILSGCMSLERKLQSCIPDDNVCRSFVSRVRNKKKRTGSQRRNDEHLVWGRRHFWKWWPCKSPSVQAQNKECTQQMISRLTLPFKWDLLRSKHAIFIRSRFVLWHAGLDWTFLLKTWRVPEAKDIRRWDAVPAKSLSSPRSGGSHLTS